MELTEQAEHLRRQLRGLSQALLFLERGEVGCCGVTVSQCNILMEVSQQDTGLTSSEVAARLGLDLSTVSRVADGLVRLNLLRKEAGAVDRRHSVLSLTDRGKDLVNRINEDMNDLALVILNNIPEEKRSQVLESIGLLIAALRNLKGGCCLG